MKNFTFLLRTTFVALISLYSSISFSQTTIASYDFVDGLQGWTTNSNSWRGTNSTWSCDNSVGHLSIREDTSTSNVTSPALDLTGYSSINYSFCFKSQYLEGNDGFIVEYFDGSSWNTLHTYSIGSDFANSGSSYSYSFTLSLDSSTYNLASNARFRFVGNSNNYSEVCFFDNTVIEGIISENSSGPIDFDGIDDYIDYGNNHDYTESLSIEAWILQENTSTASTIVSKANAKTGNESGYSLELNNNYPRFVWYKSTGQTIVDITSPYAISNNKWYHVAVTVGNNSAQLYVDGVEVENGNTTSNPDNNGNIFIVGAKYNSDAPTAPVNYFDGFIDEVRVWDVSLSADQIHEMMNQEIEQNGTAIRGKIISNEISGDLLWANLKGYYTMLDNSAVDQSSNTVDGSPQNTTTEQLQTAPMPYISKADGEWSDTSANTPWLYGNTVWNAPNSIGIDGSTEIDWNIVHISNNINSGLKDITVLGLISDTSGKTLTIANPNENQDENNSGQGLRVTHYLKLDGNIDLVGESQLLQDTGSILDVNSSGKLQKDQQGTRDLYTYNYWSSPVGLSNTTTNNNSYTVPDVFKDGTNSTIPLDINFLNSGYDGNSGTPISIADYWIWKYTNSSGDYSEWQHVRSTGTLQAGEGFTLKGVEDTNNDVALRQNYVFEGKPNNGDIYLTIDSGNDYLIGNPYPSAIDAHQFLLDNRAQNNGNGVFTGPLYFWNHWGNGSHALSDYQGGYATYSMSGGAPAPSSNGANNSNADKKPGRYIPVGQGFFVSSQTGATIKFSNDQRVFQREDGNSSVYLRSAGTSENLDTRTKIRIGFNSVTGLHRQLLLTLDPNTTAEFDWGYDALVYEIHTDDMFWMLNNDKYVIQSTNEIYSQSVIPLGIVIQNDGLNNITIDDLENVQDDLDIYLHDKELELYQNLRESNYELYLSEGEYLDRFELTFSNNNLLNSEHIENENLRVHTYYSNYTKSVVLINPYLIQVKSLEIFNILGQSINQFSNIDAKDYTAFKTNISSSGAYIIKLNSANGIISKKILVE